MDDFVVNSQLYTIIIDDEDADAATAIIKRLGETLKEIALVKDGKTLLDITSLSHGDDSAILTDVENTVLLEYRTEHVLDNDGWSRVGDEAGLLMELLGEQVNTEVTMLAGLGRGGDADHLARAALKDQEIANADVVARDSDGVGRSHGAGFEARCLNWGSEGDARRSCFGRGIRFLDYNFLSVVVAMVMMAGTVDGVKDTIGSFVETVAEGVVVTVFVVVSHVTLELLGGFSYSSSSLFYSNFFSGLRRITFVDEIDFALPVARLAVFCCLGSVLSVNELDVALTVAGLGILSCLGSVLSVNKLDVTLIVTGLGVLSCLGGVTFLDKLGWLTVTWLGGSVGVTWFGVATSDGAGAFTKLAFSYVYLGGSVVGGRAVDSVKVSVVNTVLDVDLSSNVALVGLLIALSCELNLGNAVLGIAAVLLKGTAFYFLFSATGTADAFFFVDTNFLLIPRVLAVGSDGEGFGCSFVTFPSDVRSLRR